MTVAALFAAHAIRFVGARRRLRYGRQDDEAAAYSLEDQEMAYIKSIEFPLRLAGIRMGTVNCYLIAAGTGYVLVDTAFAANHAGLERELEDARCRPGDLRLIVMTHGDLDHAGNGAYLREKYGAKIAMQRYESAVVENGAGIGARRKGSAYSRAHQGLYRDSHG